MAEDTGLRAAVILPGSTRQVRGLRVRIELTSDTTGWEIPDPQSRHGCAADCAYVVFTSGTTGRPKPVAIPHRGVVRLVLSDHRLPSPGPGDRVLHAYGLSSDASTIEIWGALLTGACLVIADREELLSRTALAELFRAQNVTIAYLTTSVFHLVARTSPESRRGSPAGPRGRAHHGLRGKQMGRRGHPATGGAAGFAGGGVPAVRGDGRPRARCVQHRHRHLLAVQDDRRDRPCPRHRAAHGLRARGRFWK